MSKEEFVVLHAHCETTMQVYWTQVQKTCGMLGACMPEPLSFAQRFALLQQEITERDAHTAYGEAKRVLHAAALLGYDATPAAIVPNPS